MAVNCTIRCKTGISNFLLPTENSNECVTAFEYIDKKAEVYSLKKDCPPLNLEEGTKISLLSHDSYGTLLLAITPSYSTGCLNFCIWDVGTSHGFVPKEIDLKVEHTKESKFHCTYNVQQIMKEELQSHICTTLDCMLCLILNGKFCILINTHKNDSGGILFDIKTLFLLTDFSSPVVDILFLKDQQKTFLLLAEEINVNIMEVDKDLNLTNSTPISISGNPSKARCISHFLRITCSKCLVIDKTGCLSLISMANSIVSLKLPTSISGHGICTVVGFRHTSEGILAICNDDYTVNLYSLADVITSVNNGVSHYVKPYRILCSQFPINSLSFVRCDQLAMASSANQSITFWGGLSQQIN